MKVHVIGPVIRGPGELSPTLRKIYLSLNAGLIDRGFDVDMPVATPALEYAAPQRFYSAIEKKIQESSLVITVLEGARSLSPPVEATIASFLNRAQYFLYESPEDVPRLLLGLKNVTGTFGFNEIGDLINDVNEKFGGFGKVTF
jgi:hypothetical protein